MSKKVLIGILGIIILIGICWVFNYIRFLNSLPKVEPLPISVMQDKLCPKILHDNAIMLLEPHKCDHNIYVAHTLGSNIYYDSQGNEITTCSYDGSLSNLLGITVKGSWKCRYLRILHCEFFCPDIKEEDKTADWQTYRNREYGFEIKYPSDWTTYDYITAGLEYNNTITKETATIEIGKKMTGVEYEGIKLAEEKIDQYISQMRTVIKPKTKIKIGDYDGYEVIGTLCTRICTGSSEDIYTPFSVIYLSDGTNIFKITYLEGISGVGWKDNINDWINYDAYNQILSTFRFFEETCFDGEFKWAPRSNVQEVDKFLEKLIINRVVDAAIAWGCLKEEICKSQDINWSDGQKIDLNKDGFFEYIVILGTTDNCYFRGVTGNGPIDVYGFFNGQWILVGELEGNMIASTEIKTNGYLNLITHLHSSSVAGYINEYNWDGEKYKLKRSIEYNPEKPAPSEYLELFVGG